MSGFQKILDICVALFIFLIFVGLVVLLYWVVLLKYLVCLGIILGLYVALLFGRIDWQTFKNETSEAIQNPPSNLKIDLQSLVSINSSNVRVIVTFVGLLIPSIWFISEFLKRGIRNPFAVLPSKQKEGKEKKEAEQGDSILLNLKVDETKSSGQIELKGERTLDNLWNLINKALPTVGREEYDVYNSLDTKITIDLGVKKLKDEELLTLRKK